MTFDIRLMCKVLNVSRSGLYAWLERKESNRTHENREMTELIRSVFDDSRKIYGAPRVFWTLRHRGVSCGRNRVARLMRVAGLRSKTKRKYRVNTTDSNHSLPIAPDLIERNFHADQANETWVSDMTYIPTDEGWLYLAATMDLFSRRIVGWSMAPTMHATIVVDALQMAIDQRSPAADLVHHSDRGSQYASKVFRSQLTDHGLLASMSRKGNCYDNAAMESFFHSLKTELVSHEHYRSHVEARASLFDYIEAFYNRERLHSTLDYMSPTDFEDGRTKVA